VCRELALPVPKLALKEQAMPVPYQIAPCVIPFG